MARKRDNDSSQSTQTRPTSVLNGSDEPLKPAEIKLERSAPAQIANGSALLCICSMAFFVRLFSVIKYESVIHEFDPYFNYRVTQFLTKNGFYDMWNWFDDRTWYPLGRVVGGTVYPVKGDATTFPAALPMMFIHLLLFTDFFHQLLQAISAFLGTINRMLP